MIIWRFCQISLQSRLKQLYNVLPLSFRKNRISTTIIYSCTMNLRSPSTVFDKPLQKWKLKDKVSKECVLVYRSTMEKFIIGAYHISYFIFITSTTGFYYVFQSEIEYPLYEPGDNLESKITIYSQVEAYLIYGAIIVYNSFGFLCCRRCMLRIWYNPSQNLYTGVLPSLYPIGKRQIIFKPGSARVRFYKSTTPLVRSVHVINRWNYYMPDTNFPIPSEYHRLIGEVS